MTKSPPPLAKYNSYREVKNGTLYTLAGQGCRDPHSNQCVGLKRDEQGKVISYNISEQTRGVFANIDRVLNEAGLTKKNIVDITVFLCSMSDFAAMNQEWNDYFAEESVVPTRTTVAVSALPGDNFIEMKVLACK